MKTLTSKQLFLIDALGAITSAIFLGVVLVKLESYIGMPVNVLYLLAALALLFAVYSLSCYTFTPANWQAYLKLIAWVNLSYCILTLSLVIWNFNALKPLGITYFALEILIIIVLVNIELKHAKRTIAP